MIAAVHERVPLQALIRVGGAEEKVARLNMISRLKWFCKKPADYLKRGFPAELQEVYRAAEVKAVCRRFRGVLPESVPVFELSASEVNGEGMTALLDRLDPDVLFVFGAPLLNSEVFSRPGMRCINLHFGISPDYRGMNTLFWPLRMKDFGRIGFTLHEIVEQLDAGRIYVQGFPALSRRDHELRVALKTYALASREVPEFFARWQRSASPGAGRIQTGRGRLYLSREKTFREYLIYWIGWSIGMFRPPRRDESVVRY